MKCLNKYSRYCQYSIFINSDECNFIIPMTRNLMMSRDKRLLLDGNPKGYEVAEHIATKVEVYTRILSTLKDGK